MERHQQMQWETGRRNALSHGGWKAFTGIALVLAAVGALAAGCGSQESASVEKHADAGTVTVPVYETSHDAQTAGAGRSAGGSATVAATETGRDATPAAGMPPDIIVTASQTVVQPGDVIDIAVQATPDVSEMSLWDGIHDRQALAYDAEAKAWRVSYRVPLRLRWERTGLAITAKNDARRWCRSWVFIEAEKPMPLVDTGSGPAPAVSDSLGADGQALAKDVVEPGER